MDTNRQLTVRITSVVSEISEIARENKEVPDKLLFLAYGAELGLSAKALDLLFLYEFGQEREYGATPGWLHGSLKCIGAGYCWRNYSAENFRRDWKDILSDDELDLLIGTQSNSYSQGAQRLIESAGTVSDALDRIEVTPRQAIQVFGASQLPQVVDDVTNQFKDVDRLPPDSLGALVSLRFNIGVKTMERALGDAMESRNFHQIPAAIRALGDSYATDPRFERFAVGLQKRRNAEADLFENGLLEAAKITEPE